MNKLLRTTLTTAALTLGTAMATAGASTIDWPSIGGKGNAVALASAAVDSTAAFDSSDIDWPVGPASAASDAPQGGNIDWP